MRAKLAISWAFLPDFPLFQADLSFGQEGRAGSTLGRLKQHPQNQDIVRHDGAPDILPETRPALPVAAIQTKGPFQPGNIGFEAGPKVAQFLVNPQALDHLQNSQASLLGEHDFLDSFR